MRTGVDDKSGIAMPQDGTVLDEVGGMVCRRSCAAVRTLGLVSAGLAAIAVARMLGSAEIGELLLWVTGAWLAWVPIIVIKVREWARDEHMTMLREPEERAHAHAGHALV